MEYNKEKIGILVGMLLGDAYIEKNGQFSIGHSIKQKDYLLYKQERLKKFFKTSYTERNCGPNNEYLECFIRSGTSKYFKLMRRLWYKPQKRILKKMIYKISPEGLAYWYLDDGSLVFQRDKNGNIISRKGYLNTQGFTYDENLLLSEMLKEKFNIETKIHKDKKYFRLYLNSSELKKLFFIISDYIPSSMYYKLCFRYSKKYQDDNLCKKECSNNCPYHIL